MAEPQRQREDDARVAGPELSEAERRAVEERHAPTAIVIHEVIRRFGDDELRRSPQGLAWSGLAAGLSMGFSLVGQGLLLACLPLAYTIGLGSLSHVTAGSVEAVWPWCRR